MMYASLVQSVTHDDYEPLASPGYRSRSTLSPEVFTALKRHGQPLLPNLRELTWASCYNPRSMLDVLNLVSPTLKTLHLLIDNFIAAESPLLAEVFDGLLATPDLQLETFDFNVRRAHPHVEQALFRFLQAQPGINTLTLLTYHFSRQMTSAIGTLHNLRNLDLSWIMVDITDEDVNEALQQLRGSCPLLRCLTLKWGFDPKEDPKEFDFEPLLGCGWDLEELELKRGRGLKMSSTDLRRMGETWPNLRRLHVYWMHFSPADPVPLGLSLSDLNVLATSFPKIENLYLILNCDEEDLAEPPTLASFNHLQTLYASEWIIPETKVNQVAAYLAHLRPEVLRSSKHQVIYGGYPATQARSDANRSRWKEVAAAIEDIQK